MGKKVFISHAAIDQQIVSLFVDQIICFGSGISIEDVVYTSREDSGIINGDDIPLSIKDGIKECMLFFMMVSDGYKKSEVCLNEMGAAWMRDDLVKKIILLPGVDFNEIGWLMSLKKATKILDSSGLDAIHDQIKNLLSIKVQTATWNRCKDAFIQKVQELISSNTESSETSSDTIDDDDEMDLLDIRDKFDESNHDSIEIINSLSGELGDYSTRLNIATTKLNKISANPKGYSTTQIRGVLYKCSNDMDNLSSFYETKIPLLKEKFDHFIEYASMMNQFPCSDEIRDANRKATKTMIDNMIGTKDEITKLKNTIAELADIDKTLKKSKNRLVKANQQLLDAISFCISRATDYMMS